MVFKNLIKRSQNHGLDSSGSEHGHLTDPYEYEDSGSKRAEILTRRDTSSLSTISLFHTVANRVKT